MAVWKGALIGGTTGVVVSVVWSYRRDDTVDVALGRAARTGAALAGAGALVGLALDRHQRRHAPARSRAAVAGLEQAREALAQAAGAAVPALEQAREALVEATAAARPRVGQAVQVARPRVEHAVEVARPRVEQAVVVARPRVAHAVERATRTRGLLSDRVAASG